MALSLSQFMTEFPHLLELLLPTPSKLLIIGDFNIHVDSKLDSVGQTFVPCLNRENFFNMLVVLLTIVAILLI